MSHNLVDYFIPKSIPLPHCPAETFKPLPMPKKTSSKQIKDAVNSNSLHLRVDHVGDDRLMERVAHVNW